MWAEKRIIWLNISWIFSTSCIFSFLVNTNVYLQIWDCYHKENWNAVKLKETQVLLRQSIHSFWDNVQFVKYRRTKPIVKSLKLFQIRYKLLKLSILECKHQQILIKNNAEADGNVISSADRVLIKFYQLMAQRNEVKE